MTDGDPELPEPSPPAAWESAAAAAVDDITRQARLMGVTGTQFVQRVIDGLIRHLFRVDAGGYGVRVRGHEMRVAGHTAQVADPDPSGE